MILAVTSAVSSVPAIVDRVVVGFAILFTVALILWIVADMQRPIDYRVAPFVERSDLGDTRTRFKIQELKWFGWKDHTSFHPYLGSLYIPLFENPAAAEKEILDIRSRFHK